MMNPPKTTSTDLSLFRRRLLGAVVAAACLMLALPTYGDGNVSGDTGDNLDIGRMKLSFEDPFNEINVSPWGPNTRWIAHTPWAGDFGGAQFADPTDKFPFTVKDGILRIEASKSSDGTWRAGLLASVDPDGNGFSQQYGYFEMRASLPSGPGLWPAFWLIGKDRSKSTAEIDAMEYYGDKPNGYSSTVHVWHKDGSHYSDFSRVNVFETADPTAYHTYGVKVDSAYVRMYFDGKLAWKTKTQPEYRQPLYILLNLGMVDGVTKMVAPDPSFMSVDYVRAYALN
jgi:beta-glucanase (GH16 family)